jgi:hypothetical protein
MKKFFIFYKVKMTAQYPHQKTTVLLIHDDTTNARDHIGRALTEEEFKKVITTNTDAFIINDYRNTKRLLFSFRKNAIKDANLWFETISPYFKTRILTSDRRFRASGIHDGKRKTVHSGIIGYYDRLTPQQKKIIGVNKAGRQTAFTRCHPDLWKHCIPFFQLVSRIYKNTCPFYYNLQKKFVDKIEPDLRIPKSIFTTVTVNQNWVTHTHTDSGDFPNGISCLVVLGTGFQGGFIGFPKRKILVQIHSGDILFMDSREPHGNTPLEFTTSNAKRLSLVCYARTDLIHFHKKITVQNGETFYI